MSLSDESRTPADRQITRYLLGLLPAEETERLDEASIADDEFAARLRIGETDLVDRYVGGTLDGETLQRFESHYLSSPRRRRNVRFAVSFLWAVDRAAALNDGIEEDDSTPVPANDQDDRRPSVSSRLVVAAAMWLVLCGALLFQSGLLRSGVNVTSDNRARTPEFRPGERPAAGAPDPARSDAVAGPLSTLVLFPQTRDVGPVPSLAIPAGVENAAFELRLESIDFPRYEVGLKDPASNQVVWRSGSMSPTPSSQTPAIVVLVPIRVLKPQHYSLTVMGRRSGDTEVVGSYTFQVQRP